MSTGSSDRAIATATLRLVPANALVALHLSTDRGRTRGARRRRRRRAPAVLAADPARPRAARLRLRLRHRPAAPARQGADVRAAARPRRQLHAAARDRRARARREHRARAPAARSSCARSAASSSSVSRASVARGRRGRRRPRGPRSSPRRSTAAPRAGLPDERVLDAWASARGTRDLLTPLGGLYAHARRARRHRRPARRRRRAHHRRRRRAVRHPARRRVRSARRAVPRRRSRTQAPADTLTYVASGDLGSGLQRWLLLAAPGAGSPDRRHGGAAPGARPARPRNRDARRARRQGPGRDARQPACAGPPPCAPP